MIITSCLLATASIAQQANTTLEASSYPQYKHELSAWGGIGYPSLIYDVSYGDRSGGLGYLGGLGYNYYINYKWSVGIGAEFSALSSSLNISKFQDFYVIPSFGGIDKPLNLEITGNDYKQKYTAYYINVPITARYQFHPWKRHNFWKKQKVYVAGGLKIGIPVRTKYTASGDYTAKAFVRDSNGENSGDAIDRPEHGFGKRQAEANGEWSAKWNWALTLEAGVKWRLSERFSLYSGVFADYGLNDIRKGDRSSQIIQYNDLGPDYEKINTPAINAVHANRTNGSAYSFTDRLNTFAVGLKVQLSFGFKPSFNKSARRVRDKAPHLVHVVNQVTPITADEVSNIVSNNTKEIIRSQDEIKALISNEEYRLKTVYGFDLDRTVILANMGSILEDNVETLKRHPEINVTLVGHTDDSATDDYNLDLGKRRAQIVKDWLVANGISASRIKVTSKGKSQPAIPNVDDTNRKYNRRVVFVED
jgi:outer membrane protein OmpA-like peptidoglycan-associated protein/opacity protein-like surface antigen